MLGAWNGAGRAGIVRLLGVLLFVWVSNVVSVVADEAVELTPPPGVSTNVEYEISISGEISTPTPDGSQQFPLMSTGEFRFRNDAESADGEGAAALQAVRRFQSATTSTTVGKDHVTEVVLSPSYRTVNVSGSDQGLQYWSPRFALPRKQLDLLQMPFDVLPTSALLPSTPVKPGDKWNTDAWLVPMLTGIEAVVEQSATCELVSVDEKKAVIAFSGNISGGVWGSTSKAAFNGTLEFDRTTNIVTSLSATQTEKRSPGPVSPGLDVTAKIAWKQSPVESTEDALPTAAFTPPNEQQLLLSLQTAIKLRLRHSREWHLFHETPSVLMMRQLRDGNLVSQCNISSTVTVPPKQHTPDREFLEDVTASVQERKGQVETEETVRADKLWRIRHVRAAGDADGKPIIWDYYLCTAASGEQFSIVFSHAKADEKLFGDEAMQLLSTLQMTRARPALPFQ